MDNAFDCFNLHFIDKCNFGCNHCFVKKENQELTLPEIKTIVDKIKKYFVNYNISNGRINLAGGEPLLSKNIAEIIDYIINAGIRVSIITNGYLLTEDFVKKHNRLYCIGISVDSLDCDVNLAIGRHCNKKTLNNDKLTIMCQSIKKAGIKLKINTCVTRLNYKEDFSGFLEEIKPDRYKVFQAKKQNEDHFVNDLYLSDEEMKVFLLRHERFISVYESSKDMDNSYIIIDSKGNLSTDNFHESSLSILDCEVDEAIKTICIDKDKYEKRYFCSF